MQSLALYPWQQITQTVQCNSVPVPLDLTPEVQGFSSLLNMSPEANISAGSRNGSEESTCPFEKRLHPPQHRKCSHRIHSLSSKQPVRFSLEVCVCSKEVSRSLYSQSYLICKLIIRRKDAVLNVVNQAQRCFIAPSCQQSRLSFDLMSWFLL